LTLNLQQAYCLLFFCNNKRETACFVKSGNLHMTIAIWPSLWI